MNQINSNNLVDPKYLNYDQMSDEMYKNLLTKHDLRLNGTVKKLN
jgi:hypothetical protein